MPMLLLVHFTKNSSKEEHDTRALNTAVLLPVQFTSMLQFAPRTNPKTSHKDHGQNHDQEHHRASIGNSLFKPKVRVMKGDHLLFSSKQRLVRILAAFGDLEAGENFIGCSSTRIWKQEGSLWIIFHFLSLIFVCFVKE